MQAGKSRKSETTPAEINKCVSSKQCTFHFTSEICFDALVLAKLWQEVLMFSGC